MIGDPQFVEILRGYLGWINSISETQPVPRELVSVPVFQFSNGRIDRVKTLEFFPFDEVPPSVKARLLDHDPEVSVAVELPAGAVPAAKKTRRKQ